MVDRRWAPERNTTTTTYAGSTTPQRLPSSLRADWAQLTRPTEPEQLFDPGTVDHLPAPARRWLRHAIAAGTPLRRTVVLGQHGMIRLGSWRRFRAVQALAPLEGFIWVVTTRLFGLPVHGFDRYSAETGEMRHRLLGRFTVMSATGPDVSRSAAARHTSEIIWVPAAALAPQVGWRAIDDVHVTALVPCDGRTYEPTLTVSASGAVEKVTVPHWTNVGNMPWHEETFTALLGPERAFGGYTVPAETTAGWGFGTDRWADGGFIKQTIDTAAYR